MPPTTQSGVAVLGLAILRRRSRPFATGTVPGLLAWGIAGWDHRTVGERAGNARWTAAAAVPFGQQIRPGQTVYWQQNVNRVWFELRTASYAGGLQATGIVLSQAMAGEVARRLARVALADSLESSLPAGGADPLQARSNDLHAREAYDLNRPGLLYLCRDPELDFVLHERRFAGLVRAEHHEFDGTRNITWNLYDCQKLRTAA